MPEVVTIGTLDTPLGQLGAALSPVGLARLTLPNESVDACIEWARQWLPAATIVEDQATFEELSHQLNGYCERRRRNFRVRLDLRGTPFQLAIWRALRKIGYGQTLSYAQLGAAVGHPTAARAVGAAVGDNPVPIIVPCHRVIGSDGSLIGYAGGLDLKRHLLEHEGAIKPLPPRAVQPPLFE